MSAPKASTHRLQKEYIKINRDPPPYITALPLPNNILEWHYVIKGPEDSLYAGGYYHGKLLFPQDYPFKPPGIVMITPSGRFQCNTRLCLTLSDYHPEQWHPGWSVSSILIGLLSFMLENTPTAGSIETTDNRKREFAQKSLVFNLSDIKFVKLFPELSEQMRKELSLIEKMSGSQRQPDDAANALPSSETGVPEMQPGMQPGMRKYNFALNVNINQELKPLHFLAVAFLFLALYLGWQ